MASQEEAVALVAPGEEEVKKVGEFSVNGAPNDSFNSRISSVPGDIGDMAESQVAVAGSVDSAVEPPVSAGAEPDAVSASVDTGPASSSDIVDATEKVESWDLSEAVQEGATNKEDSKPNFSEDGTLEDIKTQDVSGASSDLIADAPASAAASMEDSAGGEPSANVEEKAVDVSSEDAGVASVELPAEVAVSDDVNPKIQDEGSAEKGDSGAPEPPVEEFHEVAEATTSPEPDKEVASLEVVPSPSADVEEKSVVVEDKSVDVEDEPVDVEDKSIDVEDKPIDIEDKPIDVAEKSVEVNSEDAGVVSEELPAEVAASEEVSPKIPDEGSAEKGDSEAPEPPVQEVHEVAEATASVEPPVEEVHEVTEATTSVEPDEEVASVEAVPSPSADVEEKAVDVEEKSVDVEDKPVDVEDKPVDIADKSIEVNSEDAGVMSEELPAEVAASEEVSPKIPDEGSAEKIDTDAPVEEVHEVAEATGAEPDEEVAGVETVPSPSADVEEKYVEVASEAAGAVSADVSPKTEAEGSAEKGDSEAPEPPVEEVAEATTIAEPDEEVASLESAPAPSDAVKDKSVQEDAEATTSAEPDEEVASLKSAPAPSDAVEDKSVQEDAEATTSAEPGEEVASLESAPPPSDAVEDKSVQEDAEATTSAEPDEEVASLKSAPAPSDAVEDKSVQEDAEATTSAEPDEEVASLESAPAPSDAVEDKSVQGDAEATTSAEPDEVASLESAPAPADAVKDKSVQEVDSEDTSEASKVLPSGSADNEDISPAPPAEGAADNVGSETLYVPDEEVHEVVEATISAEPDEAPVAPEAPSDVVEDKSVDANSEDAIGVTTALGSVDNEDVNPEPATEATTSAGADASLESGAVEGSASLESVSSPAAHVQDRSLEVNPEDTSEAKIELPTESADNEDVSPELPAEGSADKVGSEALFTPVEEVHEVVEATIAPEPDEVSTSPESGPAPADIEEKPVEKSEDMSVATTTELPTESVDKEVVSRDLPSEEVHAPIEEIGKVEDAATKEMTDAESAVLESVATSSEEVHGMLETTSREFNFSDLKEALTTSDDVTSEKATTAIVEEGSSSDAVAGDTTPLEVSSPPPAVENKGAPSSYDLHEVVVNLEDAAEKTLEDAKSSILGDRQGSVAESVARIVLDESGKTEDSSELISGVIQHVAQLAQDDFRADPNVLPDTVNQVFDREIAGSPANEASSQPKENTSLGTKFSLFVIWCISLCASHVSSKDMPAPALKLGAEEVAAVLHSNSQGAASSKAASSV